MSERDDELSALIKSKATRHAAPAQLRARIGIAIKDPESTGPGWRPREAWHRWINVGAAFAVGLVASFAVLLALRGTGDEDRMVQAVVDSHVRSPMGDHLVDVQSSDKHTVKPWFFGKLDYAPTVKDLAPEGVPLVGGRLDYLGQRAGGGAGVPVEPAHHQCLRLARGGCIV